MYDPPSCGTILTLIGKTCGIELEFRRGSVWRLLFLLGGCLLAGRDQCRQCPGSGLLEVVFKSLLSHYLDPWQDGANAQDEAFSLSLLSHSSIRSHKCMILGRMGTMPMAVTRLRPFWIGIKSLFVVSLMHQADGRGANAQGDDEAEAFWKLWLSVVSFIDPLQEGATDDGGDDDEAWKLQSNKYMFVWLPSWRLHSWIRIPPASSPAHAQVRRLWFFFRHFS